MMSKAKGFGWIWLMTDLLLPSVNSDKIFSLLMLHIYFKRNWKCMEQITPNDLFLAGSDRWLICLVPNVKWKIPITDAIDFFEMYIYVKMALHEANNLGCSRTSVNVDDWKSGWATSKVFLSRIPLVADPARRGSRSSRIPPVTDPARRWSCLSSAHFFDRPHWPRVCNRLQITPINDF